MATLAAYAADDDHVAGRGIGARGMQRRDRGGSGNAASTTEPARFPTAVVRDWIDAVTTGDLSKIAVAVDETSASILIATENSYSVDELAALLDGGISEGIATTYWSSFEEAFLEFRGVGFSSLVVGDFRSLNVADAVFAAVELVSPDGVSEVIARRHEDGRWRIDMVATFGPALVRSLRTTLDAATTDPNGVVVRSGYARSVLPGLRAAIELNREDTLLRSELAAMELLVGNQ